MSSTMSVMRLVFVSRGDGWIGAISRRVRTRYVAFISSMLAGSDSKPLYPFSLSLPTISLAVFSSHAHRTHTASIMAPASISWRLIIPWSWCILIAALSPVFLRNGSNNATKLFCENALECAQCDKIMLT